MTASKIFLQAFVMMLLWLDPSAAVKFSKCCPEGEIVQVDSIEDHNLSPRKHFTCVRESSTRAKVKKKRESDDYESSNSSIPHELIAYNVLIDENSHWPSCGDNSFLSMAALTDSVKASQSASCIDIMNANHYVFSCDERLDAVSDFVDIYKLRKCCGPNFSYNIFTRQCVNNNETTLHEEFQEFLRDRVVTFEPGIPECKADEVLIEYHSHVHKLKLYESSLIITANAHGPDVLMQNSYCLESTLNSNVNLPDGADQQNFLLKSSSRWIAKVCRNQIICKEMPCVRKCCKEGQRMVYENETLCEDHDRHLDVKFHFFDIRESPERPNAMEPTGECSTNKYSKIF